MMRFDGSLGFPGGLINPGENVVEGTNRELREEIGLDTAKFKVSNDNFLMAHHKGKNSRNKPFSCLFQRWRKGRRAFLAFIAGRRKKLLPFL